MANGVAKHMGEQDDNHLTRTGPFSTRTSPYSTRTCLCSTRTAQFLSRTGRFYSRTGSFYSRTGLFYSSRTEQFSSRTGPCSSRTGRARRERVVNQREAVPDENRGAYRITERYREWGCHRLIHPPIQQTHAANQLSQPIHPTPHTCHRSFLVHSMPASLLSIFCQLA